MRNVMYVEGILTNMTGNAFWRNVGSTIVNMTISETDVSDMLQMTGNGFYENYGTVQYTAMLYNYKHLIQATLI